MLAEQIEAEAVRRDRADELLNEYSIAVVRAQTTKKPEDWLEAGKAFDTFDAALRLCATWAPWSASLPVSF